MPESDSHYLLFSEAGSGRPCSAAPAANRWRFVLEALSDGRRKSAEDVEPDTPASRLELLAVVRGLEALEGPSRVTLITRSRYVSRGLRHGLTQWRRDNWCWERFGRLVPVRDHDLWQRVDRALQYHHVDCRCWRFPEDDRDSKPTHDPQCSLMSESISCHPETCPAGTHSQRSSPTGVPDAPHHDSDPEQHDPAVIIVPATRRRCPSHAQGLRGQLRHAHRFLTSALGVLGHQLGRSQPSGV